MQDQTSLPRPFISEANGYNLKGNFEIFAGVQASITPPVKAMTDRLARVLAAKNRSQGRVRHPRRDQSAIPGGGNPGAGQGRWPSRTADTSIPGSCGPGGWRSFENDGTISTQIVAIAVPELEWLDHACLRHRHQELFGSGRS
jgi:hypothetical protein